MLLGVWDQNVALPVMSPVAARLDELAARWCCQLVSLPDAAIAAFCSGASIANLTCIVAARDTLLHRVGWNVDQRGPGRAPLLRVVASAEIHASVAKALRAAGIGTDQVESAPTDELGRVLVDQFPLSIARLRELNEQTGTVCCYLRGAAELDGHDRIAAVCWG